VTRFGAIAHLARRFTGSLSRRPPSEAELAWVTSMLSPAEWELWRRLGPVDQRHAVLVARRAVAALGGPEPDRAFVAGALLHDIGKLHADLGTVGRVVATIWGGVRGPRAATGRGRLARYLRHESTGAAWCAAIGSDPRTVSLVGGPEHGAGPAGAAPAWHRALATADDL
jgi:hypothetical protein